MFIKDEAYLDTARMREKLKFFFKEVKLFIGVNNRNLAVPSNLLRRVLKKNKWTKRAEKGDTVTW